MTSVFTIIQMARKVAKHMRKAQLPPKVAILYAGFSPKVQF